MLDPEIEVIRVDGAATCPWCSTLYREHPWDQENTDWQGQQFLRVGCDGRRLKL